MKGNFLYIIFAIAVFLTGVNHSAYAQKHVDLQLSIVSPQNGEVIPFGDTAYLNISIKNLGPDTLFDNSDSLYYGVIGLPFTSSNWANIPPFDSAIFGVLSGYNSDSTLDNETFCVYLLPFSSSYVDTNQLNDTACVSFSLAGSSSLGIGSIATNFNKHFSISPNPASQLLHLNFNLEHNQPIIVLVHDLLGRELIHKDLGMLSGNQKQQLDISSLHSGIYMVELRTGNWHWIQKLMVN